MLLQDLLLLSLMQQPISLLLLLQLKILLLINKKDILQNERPSKKGRFFIVYKKGHSVNNIKLAN